MDFIQGKEDKIVDEFIAEIKSNDELRQRIRAVTMLFNGIECNAGVDMLYFMCSYYTLLLSQHDDSDENMLDGMAWLVQYSDKAFNRLNDTIIDVHEMDATSKSVYESLNSEVNDFFSAHEEFSAEKL